MTEPIQGIDETKYDAVFREFSFNDLAGNVVKIKPWSLTKTKVLGPLVGKMYEDIKTINGDEIHYTEDGRKISDMNVFFVLHLEKFYLQFIDPLCEILCKSVDRGADWLDHMDHALAICALDVIWRQNFTGPRVMDQVGRFFPLAAAPQSPPESPLPNPPATDLPLPGNI